MYNFAKVATQWNSGVTWESNPGPRARIPSALTTKPLNHTAYEMLWLWLTGFCSGDRWTAALSCYDASPSRRRCEPLHRQLVRSAGLMRVRVVPVARRGRLRPEAALYSTRLRRPASRCRSGARFAEDLRIILRQFSQVLRSSQDSDLIHRRLTTHPKSDRYCDHLRHSCSARAERTLFLTESARTLTHVIMRSCERTLRFSRFFAFSFP